MTLLVYQRWHWIKATWKEKLQLTPSVALAVLNTVSGIALAIALGEGVNIAWWRKCLHGATVADLHQSWAYSASRVDLLGCWKNFNIIALACLAMYVVLVENLLLQKAAESVPGFFTAPAQISVPVATAIPATMGAQTNGDGTTGFLTVALGNVLKDYSTSGGNLQQLITTHWDSNCIGSCTTNLRAAGFSIECDRNSIDRDLDGRVIEDANDNENSISTLLSTKFKALYAGEYDSTQSRVAEFSHIQYSTIRAWYSAGVRDFDGNETLEERANNCWGEQRVMTCRLRPVILEYPVEINNNTKEIQAQKGVRLQGNIDADIIYFNYNSAENQLAGYRVISPLPSEPKPAAKSHTFLGAITLALNDLLRTQMSLKYSNATGWSVTPASTSLGSWWLSYSQGYFSSGVDQDVTYSGSGCAYLVEDPTQYIVSQLNEIMLRLSLRAAWDLENTAPLSSDVLTSKWVVHSASIQNHTASQTIDTLIYKSNYGYMGGAIASMSKCSNLFSSTSLVNANSNIPTHLFYTHKTDHYRLAVVCTLMILPTFYGYWQLGRPVTLGPLEIAYAFQAPLLSSTSPAAGNVDTLIHEVGARKVQYGLVEAPAEEGDGKGKLALAIAEPHLVQRLDQGEDAHEERGTGIKMIHLRSLTGSATGAGHLRRKFSVLK